MPTDLPKNPHKDLPPVAPAARLSPHHRGILDVMVAGALLLGVLGLVCEKYLPPTPAYSLAQSVTDIQLSP